MYYLSFKQQANVSNDLTQNLNNNKLCGLSTLLCLIPSLFGVILSPPCSFYQQTNSFSDLRCASDKPFLRRVWIPPALGACGALARSYRRCHGKHARPKRTTKALCGAHICEPLACHILQPYLLLSPSAPAPSVPQATPNHTEAPRRELVSQAKTKWPSRGLSGQ